MRVEGLPLRAAVLCVEEGEGGEELLGLGQHAAAAVGRHAEEREGAGEVEKSSGAENTEGWGERGSA